MMIFYKECTVNMLIKITPLAEADLEEIWFYTYKKWDVKQADSYQNSIVSVFRGLAEGVNTGRAVEVREGYFKYVIGSHLVFYTQSDEHIKIIRILHQRMDIEEYL